MQGWRRQWSKSYQLNQFQAPHAARGGCEFVILQPHPPQHRNEKVRQWIIVISVERQMLAVFKSATGKNGWQVCGHMSISVPKVGAVKHHGTVEQGFAVFLNGFQFAEQI